MMSPDWLGVGAALISAACIALLAVTDPKRRAGAPAPSALRRPLPLVALAPGIALAAAGRWSAFLIWIGAAAVLGWGIAALVNIRKREHRPEKTTAK